MPIDRFRRVKQAVGRSWGSVLMTLAPELSLAIEQAAKSSKGVPCPLCGGRDRFRMHRDGSGGGFCRHEHPTPADMRKVSDGIGLLAWVRQVTLLEALERLEEHLGISDRPQRRGQRPWRPLPPPPPPPPPPVEPLPSGESSFSQAQRWLEASRPIIQDATIPRRYFQSRGLSPMLSWVKCLSIAWLRADERPRRWPVLLAPLYDNEGQMVQMHRTYLMPNGSGKAPMENARRQSRQDGSWPRDAYGAVKLGVPTNGLYGIAEGIETALAAAELHRHPVWAAICAHGLGMWQWPADCVRLVIYADHDENEAGLNAAHRLGDRALDAGLDVEILMPEHVGWDFNDVLRDRKKTNPLP